MKNKYLKKTNRIVLTLTLFKLMQPQIAFGNALSESIALSDSFQALTSEALTDLEKMDLNKLISENKELLKVELTIKESLLRAILEAKAFNDLNFNGEHSKYIAIPAALGTSIMSLKTAQVTSRVFNLNQTSTKEQLVEINQRIKNVDNEILRIQKLLDKTPIESLSTEQLKTTVPENYLDDAKIMVTNTKNTEINDALLKNLSVSEKRVVLTEAISSLKEQKIDLLHSKMILLKGPSFLSSATSKVLKLTKGSIYLASGTIVVAAIGNATLLWLPKETATFIKDLESEIENIKKVLN